MKARLNREAGWYGAVAVLLRRPSLAASRSSFPSIFSIMVCMSYSFSFLNLSTRRARAGVI